MTNEERGQLDSFRRAAAQVREASIIAGGHRIDVAFRPGDAGYMDVYVKLLGQEPFRSLALAIRLAYMRGEPAYFQSVCNLLYREGDDSIKERVAVIRDQYHAALRSPEDRLVVGDGADMAVFTAQQVFEHWSYGVAFHQDPDRQQSVRLLASLGPSFPWSFQSTALQLAGRIIDLDDVVADLLGEARVARL